MLRIAGLNWFHNVPAQASSSSRPRGVQAATHGHPIPHTEIQGKPKPLSWSPGQCVSREQTQEGVIEEFNGGMVTKVWKGEEGSTGDGEAPGVAVSIPVLKGPKEGAVTGCQRKP